MTISLRTPCLAFAYQVGMTQAACKSLGALAALEGRFAR
jgi:hypothetical protein